MYLTCRNGRRPPSPPHLLLLLCACLLACEQPTPDPRREAALSVNGRSVTVEAFNREFERKRESYEPVRYRGDEALVKLRLDLANETIERMLLLEEAERRKIVVTEEELEKAVGEMRSMYRGEDLKRILLKKYIDYDEWRERLREDLIRKKTARAILASVEAASAEEIHDYYDRHVWDYRIPEEVHASQIVVATREEGEEILALLKKKEITFAEAAGKRSIGPEAEAGGDLGYFRRGQMPPEFDEVVFGLRKNKFSSVVQSPYGFHIFLVHDKRPAHLRSLEEVKNEITETLARRKRERMYAKFVKALRSKARIELNERLFKKREGSE